MAFSNQWLVLTPYLSRCMCSIRFLYYSIIRKKKKNNTINKNSLFFSRSLFFYSPKKPIVRNTGFASSLCAQCYVERIVLSRGPGKVKSSRVKNLANFRHSVLIALSIMKRNKVRLSDPEYFRFADFANWETSSDQYQVQECIFSGIELKYSKATVGIQKLCVLCL